MSTDDLLQDEADRGRLCRAALPQGRPRRVSGEEALTGLAKLEGKGELPVLLDAIRNQDAEQSRQDESVVFDLIRLLTSRPAGELAKVRGELEKMATGAKLPVTRQLGFVALIAADGNADKAWALAEKSVTVLARPGQRHAADPRPEPAGRPLSESRAAAGSAATRAGKHFVDGKSVQGPLCPHRAARHGER